MPQPHALIVDDSKTAQVRLRKMLDRYDLVVDMATSAEEALSYLSYQAPAVVFMDHHMEGMDGLEALRIMKSNPATAMIPVIMYTSEKGDVYVGQARAMGALDIISKEVIKPSNLARVLASLNIQPRSQEAEAEKAANTASLPTPAPRSAEPASGENAAVGAELQAVRNQVARLFEIHIADVRQQVADSTKFIVRRLSRDIEDRLAAAAKPGPDADELQLPPEPRGDGGVIGVIFSALILVGLLMIGYQTVSASREQQALAQELNNISALTERQAGLLQDLTRQVGSSRPLKSRVFAPPSNDAVFLEAVSWAAGMNPQFPHGQAALGEERIGDFARLLGLLDAARYRGTVFVDLHFGNFCVVRAENGELILPDTSATMDDCKLLTNLERDFPIEDQLSLGFASFMQTQPALVNKRMELQLNSRGLDEPSYDYPTLRPDLKAHTWNAYAQLNNRMEVSFSPSGS